MRIGIDARMLGPNVGGGGLGRYVEELVRELSQLDHKHRFILFLKEAGQMEKIQTSENVEKRMADVHWYTLKEQLVMPRLIDREQLDLVHFPHWNVPLFLRTPFVVTIHDLILLDEPCSARATTRHPLVFALKRLGYRLVLRSALKRARTIIAVSQFTKSRLLHHFPWLPSQKIHVVYEGLTQLQQTPPDLLFDRELRVERPLSRGGERVYPPFPRGGQGGSDRGVRGGRPSLLYIGNAYPHKNLERLLDTFSLLRETNPHLTLTLAGRDDVFYRRLRARAQEMSIAAAVRFVPNPTDEQLAALLQEAALYVFPSLNEGFGLPPLEAMNAGLPVAAARAGSLPEILGNAALWFDPRDVQDMVRAIQKGLTNRALCAELIAKGHERAAHYSWIEMARCVLNLYQSCG